MLSRKIPASDGEETSVIVTPGILMMAALFLVLSAVGFLFLAGLSALAIVLLRESRKLDGASDLSGRFAALRADVAALAKEHNALDELVATKMNRIATTEKRTKKDKLEQQPQSPSPTQSGILFPSLEVDPFAQEN